MSEDKNSAPNEFEEMANPEAGGEESESESDNNQEVSLEEKESSSRLTKVREEATELIDKLEALQAALKEKDDKYLRLAAEFDNYKKRTAREFGNLIETANQNLITELLEILDDFARALAQEKALTEKDALYSGMEMIYGKLEGILREWGLEGIEVIGQKFDPDLHDAVMIRETDDIPEDHIVEELQKGYKLKGKIIRHARVSVARPAPKITDGNQS